MAILIYSTILRQLFGPLIDNTIWDVYNKKAAIKGEVFTDESGHEDGKRS